MGQGLVASGIDGRSCGLGAEERWGVVGDAGWLWLDKLVTRYSGDLVLDIDVFVQMFPRTDCDFAGRISHTACICAVGLGIWRQAWFGQFDDAWG